MTEHASDAGTGPGWPSPPSPRTVAGMDLTVILGPVKSGKTLELISVLSPLPYSTLTHRVYQSARHLRDAEVVSRSGGTLVTTRVRDLAGALTEAVDVVGVDELHMFAPSDMEVVAALLARGTAVVTAGIDLDHRGSMFSTVRALLELGPGRVSYRRAVCEVCRRFTATHTQVLADGRPYLAELAPSTALPDDGTFDYEPRCRECFIAA